MKINKQTRRDGKQLFRACLVDGVLDEGRVRAVVTAVLDKRPRGYLAVLSHFSRLVKLEIQRRTATVQSPQPLTPDLQMQVRQRLESVYGPGLAMGFTVDEGLIGGLRVQVGSDVYDGSIRSRLTGLASSFAGN